MTVSTASLPLNSGLNTYIAPDDFLDCYSTDSSMPARQAAEIIVDFPSWTKTLVALRALITKPFGLDQDGPEAADKLGPFPVERTSDTEVIAGFNDKHLNFRVCVISMQNKVYLATWVHRHNIGGRIYLALILPFHILIVRNALARVAKA
jgi:hypothetical protein